MRRATWTVVVAVPLLALLAFGLQRNPNAVASPLLNKPAPSFSLRTLAGREFSLSPAYGRPVILNFWASWCTSCRAEHRSLLDAWRHYGKRITFVGVLFQDTSDGARSYMRRYGGGWPSLQDPNQDIAIGYGVAGPPETFFIDRHGLVRFKVVGPVDSDILRREIPKILGSR